MTLEQPGLGSDPPNGSGWERGATIQVLYEGAQGTCEEIQRPFPYTRTGRQGVL